MSKEYVYICDNCSERSQPISMTESTIDTGWMPNGWNKCNNLLMCPRCWAAFFDAGMKALSGVLTGFAQ